MKKFKNIAFVSAVMLLCCALSSSGSNAFAEGEDAHDLIVPVATAEALSLKDCVSPDVDILDFGELAEGGRSYTQSFLLSNKCESDIKVATKVQSYEDNTINNDFKVADEWLTFVGGQNEYVVKPGEDTIVKLRVFLPNSVKGASYYTAVGLSLADGGSADDVEVVKVRMDVTSDGFSRSGNLSSNYAHALSFGGAVKAGAKLKNTGTGGFLSKYVLKRGSLFGSGDFETLAEDTKEVPAGADVEFYGGNYTDSQYGIYKLQQSVTYINGDGEAMESVLEQTVINLPLAAVFVAGGAFVALLSLIIVVKIMKHRKSEEKSEEESENDL